MDTIHTYKSDNEFFFSNLKSNPEIRELRGGVLYEVLQSGSGSKVLSPRSKVKCHYKGMLIDGKVFDDSFKRNEPAVFRVNSLISGFQIALVNMCIGDYWRVYIPAMKGYGSSQVGIIPPDSTLVFEILLLDFFG